MTTMTTVLATAHNTLHDTLTSTGTMLHPYSAGLLVLASAILSPSLISAAKRTLNRR